MKDAIDKIFRAVEFNSAEITSIESKNVYSIVTIRFKHNGYSFEFTRLFNHSDRESTMSLDIAGQIGAIKHMKS